MIDARELSDADRARGLRILRRLRRTVVTSHMGYPVPINNMLPIGDEVALLLLLGVLDAADTEDSASTAEVAEVH